MFIANGYMEDIALKSPSTTERERDKEKIGMHFCRPYIKGFSSENVEKSIMKHLEVRIVFMTI